VQTVLVALQAVSPVASQEPQYMHDQAQMCCIMISIGLLNSQIKLWTFFMTVCVSAHLEGQQLHMHGLLDV